MNAMTQTPESPDDTPLIVSLLSRSPWWVVSAILHGLLIVLVGLVAVGAAPADAAMITYWDQTPRLLIDSDEAGLGFQRNTVATDPAQAPNSDIVIPPDILAKTPSDLFELNGENTGSSAGRFMDVDTYAAIGDATDGCGWDLGARGGDMGAGGGLGSGSGFSTRSCCRRCCGCRSTTFEYIDSALGFFATQQEPDGHWDALKNGANAKNDTAVTALALLAFLGQGHTEHSGKYQATILRGIVWLTSQQHEDGRIANPSDPGQYRGGYPHAIATQALAECARVGGAHSIARLPAQRAVDYCIQSQNPDGGWRYRPGTASDLAVTGWYVMALKSAKLARLNVDTKTLEGVNAFLDSVEIRGDTADTYTPVSQFRYQPDIHAPVGSKRLNAVGILARLALGGYNRDWLSSVDASNQRGGLPRWNDGADNAETIDLYYIYFGSLCNAQMGGDGWKAWGPALLRALTPLQHKDGPFKGSWPVTGAYSSEWGVIGQTALATLCLEIQSGNLNAGSQ